MEIILNDKNLSDEIVSENKEKVRAVIIDEEGKLLIANYGGIILLPGGKVDHNEKLSEAIIRELKEELGIEYSSRELEYFLTVKFYQNNYPNINGDICNRKITTHYYITTFKGIIDSNRNLSEREKEGNLFLELLSLEELKYRLKEINNNNPRSIYFNKELTIVIKQYLNHIKNNKTIIKERK